MLARPAPFPCGVSFQRSRYGWKDRGAAPAQQPSFELAGESRQPAAPMPAPAAAAATVSARRPFSAVIPSIASSTTSVANTSIRYLRMVRNCSLVSRSASRIDGADDRRIEASQTYRAARARAVAGAGSPGRRHTSRARARGTRRCRTRAGSAARSCRSCIVSSGSDRENRSPMRRCDARRVRGEAAHDERRRPAAANVIITKTSSPL